MPQNWKDARGVCSRKALKKSEEDEALTALHAGPSAPPALGAGATKRRGEASASRASLQDEFLDCAESLEKDYGLALSPEC